MAVSTESEPSKKAITKRLRSKISAEILTITGLKKLPGYLKKAIKKASKKISMALEQGPGDHAEKKEEGDGPIKELPARSAKKTPVAKNKLVPSDPGKQNKRPVVKKTNQVQPKAAPKKAIKKAAVVKSKPA